MSDFSFRKGERLSSSKAISSLFQSGRVVVSPPFRFIYIQTGPGEFPARMAVSVPKRLYRRAVDRNLLKRRIREAYRMRKPVFYDQLTMLGKGIEMVIQYQHGQKMDFKSIEEALHRGMEKVITQLNE
jgi:ribonuclease P protein component